MSLRVTELLKRKRPVIMGIVNLTPDSFSDGRPHASVEDFVSHATGLIEDGADIIDVGAESTRPGSVAVSSEAEYLRLDPFLKMFRSKFPDFPLSLDTRHHDTAIRAVRHDIDIINDVSCLRDPRLARIAGQHQCHYVLMHTRGTPQSMLRLTDYPAGTVNGVVAELDTAVARYASLGGDMKKLIIDPGIGFAKTPEQSLELVNHLEEFNKWSLPVLVGLSRKRFLELLIGKSEPCARDEVSAHLANDAVKKGAHIVRTHNVKMTRRIIAP